jgi:hypothetical protein
MEAGLDREQRALLALGRALRAEGYRFVTPTPESHRRVNGRPHLKEAHTLRDAFGWNRPFEESILPAHILGLAERADIVVPSADRWTSAVRFSTLPFPTGEVVSRLMWNLAMAPLPDAALGLCSTACYAAASSSRAMTSTIFS